MILTNQFATMNQMKCLEQSKRNTYQNGGLSFSEKLELASSTSEKDSEFTATDSIGIIFKQMENEGEISKTIMHNEVEIHFTRDEILGDSVIVGTEKANTKWISIASDEGGAILFDINSPEDILNCLDLFSPTEIKKILVAITMNHMAVSMQRDLEEDKNKIAQEKESAREFLESKETKETQANHILETSDINQNLKERMEDKIGKLFENKDSIGNPSLDSILNTDEKLDEENENITSSEIVVNADGSRTLIIKMKIGGMETSMNMEISKPKDELARKESNMNYRKNEGKMKQK